ncbi:MAG TPA: hypothetical protein VF053_08480 [Streptosporangiales bacterium]
MKVDGVDVVVQLWKGWCQKFLDLDTFPGGTLRGPADRRQAGRRRAEDTYWIGKWMHEPSYLRYALARRTGFLVPTDYTLVYTVNGRTYRW